MNTSATTVALNAAQANWQAVNGTFTPPSGYSSVPDLNATQVFAKDQSGNPLYSVTIGAYVDLAATLRGVNPWGTWIYANGPNVSDTPVSWFGGNQFKRVCLHDARWISGTTYYSRRGNCVAITPRCFLVSAHGSDPESGWLQWCTPPSNIITRGTSSYYIANVGSVQSGNELGYPNGYRLLYLNTGQDDLPEDMICPLLHPNDAPSLNDFVGLPVIAYSNYREATCWEIVSATIEDNNFSPSVYYFRLQKPSNSNYAKVWRRVANTSDADTITLDHDSSVSNPTTLVDDAGSGTPLFLVFTNTAGQSQFAYFGHITNPDANDYCLGPSYLQYHDDIVTGVQSLNSTHGYSGSNYLPHYITDSTWGTLTSGLVSYWKLIESSGTRADSKGSHTLSPVGTVGNTWGLLYRYSADFTYDNHLRTDETTSFEGTVTIGAWCFIRDATYPFMGLVTKDDVASGRQWSLSYYNGKFEFGIIGSASTVVQSPSVAVGKWHFVLAWYNASDQKTNIRVGTPIDSGTFGSAATTNAGVSMNSANTRVYISGYADNSYPWWGRIGPVAIWTRYLMPPEQELAWNGGDGSTYPMVG